MDSLADKGNGFVAPKSDENDKKKQEFA